MYPLSNSNIVFSGNLDGCVTRKYSVDCTVWNDLHLFIYSKKGKDWMCWREKSAV